jgi:hypothetical protein
MLRDMLNPRMPSPGQHRKNDDVFPIVCIHGGAEITRNNMAVMAKELISSPMEAAEAPRESAYTLSREVAINWPKLIAIFAKNMLMNITFQILAGACFSKTALCSTSMIFLRCILISVPSGSNWNPHSGYLLL